MPAKPLPTMGADKLAGLTGIESTKQVDQALIKAKALLMQMEPMAGLIKAAMMCTPNLMDISSRVFRAWVKGGR